MVGLVVGVFVAAALNPDRYSLLGFFGDAGAGRLDIWNVAVKTASEHLVVGMGVGGFRIQVLDLLSKLSGGSLLVTKDVNFKNSGVVEAHNMYLTLLLDLGVVGLGLWIAMYLTVFKNLWDLMKTKWSSWAWAFIGVLLALLVTSNFGSTYNQKFQWLIFGFAGAMYYRRRVTSRESRTTSHLGLAPMRPVGLKPTGLGSDSAPLDLRLRYPFRWVAAGLVLSGGVIGMTTTMFFGTPFYPATDRVLVLKLDAPQASRGIEVSDSRMQTVLALAKSDPYLIELKAAISLDAQHPRAARNDRRGATGFSGLIELSVRSPRRGRVGSHRLGDGRFARRRGRPGPQRHAVGARHQRSEPLTRPGIELQRTPLRAGEPRGNGHRGRSAGGVEHDSGDVPGVARHGVGRAAFA